MTLELRLIGGFQCWCDGAPLTLPKGSERPIAFLALQPRPVSRLYVAGTLWPDVTEARSLGNLRSALWRLGGQEIVRVDADRLSLAPTVAVDARAVEAVALRLTDPSTPAGDEALPPALRTLLSSDILPDWYDEWVLVERERLRDLRLNTLEVLGGRLLAAGDLVRARMAALAIVRAEPLRESAQRLLISAHLAHGNWADAARQLQSYRSLLRAELGVAPSPQMDALAAAAGVPAAAA